jgi:hypothetical protein
VRCLLAIAVVLPMSAFGQIYTWVDKDGQEHFTDDPHAVPAKAKVRKTTGEAISTVTVDGAPDAGPARAQVPAAQSPYEVDAPSYSEVQWRQLFREAKDKIASLEQQLELDRHKVQDNVLPMQLVCRGPVSAGCLYLPSQEYAEAKDRLAMNQAALLRARSDLEDLDRRASNAGVPREWRR